jgi:RimJ/RimL family protein N-acetyltransferase
MEIHPYAVSDKLALPLGLYDSMPIADAVSKDGEHFVIVAGLDKHMASQLKHYSLSEDDAELSENTSDRKRFGEGSYEEWYAKDRTPFALVHGDSDSLIAVVWFGPKPLGAKSMKYLSDKERGEEKELAEKAGDWHTISYRSYNPYRGKGYMKSFVQFAIDTYLKSYPSAKLWAIFNLNNQASMGLAAKVGFKSRPDLERSEEHLAVMVRE